MPASVSGFDALTTRPSAATLTLVYSPAATPVRPKAGAKFSGVLPNVGGTRLVSCQVVPPLAVPLCTGTRWPGIHSTLSLAS
ncbi:hypothetical protein D3C78_1422250 [compost metagenome]